VIGKPPITSMPHWGGIIPDDDLDALVAYLKTLKWKRRPGEPIALNRKNTACFESARPGDRGVLSTSDRLLLVVARPDGPQFARPLSERVRAERLPRSTFERRIQDHRNRGPAPSGAFATRLVQRSLLPL
jgi:hypothetical protein